jgi:hypothetical protein
MPVNASRLWIRNALHAAILAALATTGSWPDVARAEPRFGDSTWVAPSAAIEGGPETQGPRVRPRDSERAWETVIRAPFRVAFLPLRLVAGGIEKMGFLAEKIFPPGDILSVARPKKGIRISPALLGATVTATEFAGPGSKAKLTGTYAINDARKVKFKSYVGEGVSSIGMGLDGIYDRRPNRSFYGIGNSSSSEKTHYMRRASLGTLYAFTGKNHLRRLRVSAGMSDMDAGPGYNGSPRSVDVYSPADVPYLTGHSRMWWYGASAEFGALDDSVAPSLGFHFKPDMRRYQSTDGSGLSYDFWRIEARGYAPVFAKRRVLAAKLVYEGVDPRNGSGPIPFYRLPETVDSNVFPGYNSGRFRDRRLALGQLEYRWEIEEPISAFLLGSLGEVAPNTGALTLRAAHPALGGGLRAKLGDLQSARVEVARGHEGFVVQADLSAEF